MENEANFDELWKVVEHYFNWENVYNYMKLVDWTWVIDNKKDLYGIPNIQTIKYFVKERMQDAFINNTKYASTGGFNYGYENGELWLSFTIEEINTSNY